ncbi:hypothetical protein SCUCBS95973_005170 [Sporothrix curviconia]|uniref:Uncharacterized protein n=1 Tax=Sporothrix curviconia TaxID=1260050 RepID=A0ABP0BUU4_9PEZI
MRKYTLSTPHHHRSASRQTPAYEASDASTPTRTRSTSSSTFTPLSTFPSSTSRVHPIGDNLEALAHIDSLDNIDTHNPRGNIVRAVHDRVTGGPAATDVHGHGNSNNSTPDHPHSLLASPQLGLRSRVRRSGTAGASRGSASQSRSRNHSHSRRTSLENNTQGATRRSVDDKTNDDPVTNEDHENHEIHQDRGDRGSADIEDDNNDDDDDDAAKSVDSHALAWDQTCLRIAYLVSTMMTPSANPSVGGGVDADGRASETSGVARNNSQTALANAGNGPTNSAHGSKYTDADAVAAAHGIMPGVLDSFVLQCTKGWPGSDPAKMRRKIAKIMHWQNEVLACGKTVYCGCADGSPIPDDSLYASATPAAAVSAIPAPQPAGASGDAAEDAKCGHCGFVLTPKRPIVWVADPRDNNDEDVFKKVRRSQEGAGDSLRKAFKSIRGFILSKKSKQRSVSTPVATTAAAVVGSSSVPSPPTRTPPTPSAMLFADSLDKPTTCRRAWSFWDEINTDKLRSTSEEMKALFFPQTAMYHVRVECSEAWSTMQDAKRSASTVPRPKEPEDVAYEGKGKKPVHNGDKRKKTAHDDDDADDEDYDPDEADSQGERGKLQSTHARLRRAERLLQKQKNTTAAAAPQTAGN